MSQRETSYESNSRSRKIMKSGLWFIAVNFILAVLNVVVGMLSNSLAITSDAVHSLIDSVAGFLILISERLSSSSKFSSYRDRIERITTIIIAIIIILTGVDILLESIESIKEAEAPEYSIATFIILFASIGLKYLLANYLKRTGKKEHSSVLTASGAETMNDTWISVIVLFSALFYLITSINVEAYLSIAISMVIIKIGLEFIFPHLTHHHHHLLESDADHDHCGKADTKS